MPSLTVNRGRSYIRAVLRTEGERKRRVARKVAKGLRISDAERVILHRSQRQNVAIAFSKARRLGLRVGPGRGRGFR